MPQQYASAEYSGLPSWMLGTDFPIPVVRDAIEKMQQEKMASGVDDKLSDYLRQKSEGELAKTEDGVVLLVWFDSSSPEPTEEAGFVIKSGFHVSEYADFTTPEERDETVLKYFDKKTKYEALPTRRGVFGIVVGKLVKDVARKEKVVVQTEIKY